MSYTRSTARLAARLGIALSSAAIAVALAAGADTSPAHAAAAVPPVPAQDPFYTYTGSLNALAPGQVLRSRVIRFDVSGLTIPVTTTQVLYRTTDELGAPSVTVATVIRPLLATPSTKLVSYQMAYDGLASNCDPSYAIDGGTPTESTNNEEQDLLVPLLLAGDTVVSSDYEGEGLDFAAGREEGYGTLDGIRAAESLLNLPASTEVAMMGYSGGAIATDWAAELAGAYAPKLDIVGAAMGGIAVDLAHNLTYVNGSQEWSGAIPAALIGIARAFHIDLSQYLSTYGTQVVDKVGGTCLETDLGSYPGLTFGQLIKPQYTNIDQIPAFVHAIDALTMGTGGVPREPLFMGVGNADGTGDDVMVDGDDEALAHTYCTEGLPVQFTEYKGDDHETAALQFLPAAETFVTGRLNGTKVTDGCSSIGVGNSLAPLVLQASATPTPTYHAHVQFVAAAGRDVRLRLRAYGTAITGVTIELLSARGQDLARTKRNAAKDRLLTVTLAAKHTLSAGSYRLLATVSGRTLASVRFTVRSRT